MKISQTLINKATYVNLVSYCQYKGIELKREGKEYVIKDNDSIYISADEPYKWYRHSQEQGGKAIDFCVKYLGLNFTMAVKELTGAILPQLEIAPTQHFEINTTIDQKRVIAYLSKKRSLDYKLITRLIKDGKLKQDTNGNCIFLISDLNGNKVGAELHGTGDTKFKGQSSEQQGYGFVLQIGKIKQVAYFESAIDLLSFHQLYPQKSDVLLVSMGGLKSAVLSNYKACYPNAEHILCVDNDERGQAFTSKQAIRFIYPTPYKDWNEKLINLLEKK